ncbi:MAG: universal stress protein [Actinomycetes bacterium]
MAHGTRRPIMVGYDGSEASRQALGWGIKEARLRHVPLRLVHAFHWPVEEIYVPPGRLSMRRIMTEARDQAATWFAGQVREAVDAAPDVEVSGAFEELAPGRLLVDASREAEMMVVGSRGLGGFTGLLLGSVSVQLAAHAACPVFVHRAVTQESGPPRVVVGVDGSTRSDVAVRLAFEEAALRGAPLEAVHAWTHPVATGPGDSLPLVMDPYIVAQDAQAMLSECLAGYGEKYPEVPVTQTVAREHASKALLDAARRATVVVVGSRGHGGLTGLLLGSTCHALLHHATCPVLVARGYGGARRDH